MILDVFNSDADELFLLCVDKERAHPVALWWAQTWSNKLGKQNMLYLMFFFGVNNADIIIYLHTFLSSRASQYVCSGLH